MRTFAHPTIHVSLHHQRQPADDQRTRDHAAERELAQAGMEAVADEDPDQHHREGQPEGREHVAVEFVDPAQ